MMSTTQWCPRDKSVKPIISTIGALQLSKLKISSAYSIPMHHPIHMSTCVIFNRTLFCVCLCQFCRTFFPILTQKIMDQIWTAVDWCIDNARTLFRNRWCAHNGLFLFSIACMLPCVDLNRVSVTTLRTVLDLARDEKSGLRRLNWLSLQIPKNVGSHPYQQFWLVILLIGQ